MINILFFIFSSLLIEEIQYNPFTAGKVGEWIEVYNTSDTSVLLDSFKIGDEETKGGTREGMYYFPSNETILPKDVIIISNQDTAFFTFWGFHSDFEFNNSDTLIPDMVKDTGWATGDINLANAGDEILLLGANDTIIDSVNYDTIGATPAPNPPEGYSIERILPWIDTDNCSLDFVEREYPTPGNWWNIYGDCESKLNTVLSDFSANDTLTRLNDFGISGDSVSDDGVYSLSIIADAGYSGGGYKLTKKGIFTNLFTPVLFFTGDTITFYYDIKEHSDGFIPAKNISYNSSFSRIIQSPYLYGNIQGWNATDTSLLFSKQDDSLWVLVDTVAPAGIDSFYILVQYDSLSPRCAQEGLIWDNGTPFVVNDTFPVGILNIYLNTNTGRTKIVLNKPLPAVLISEFSTAPDSIELYNKCDTTISLDNWTLNSDTILSGITIPPYGFFVLDATNVQGLNLWMTGGSIILRDASNNTIDSVSYGKLGPAPAPLKNESAARDSLETNTGDNAVDFNFDPTPTFGDKNDAPAVKLGQGDIFINEVYFNDTLRDSCYIELYNRGNEDINILGWSIVLDKRIIFPDTIILARGTYIIPKSLFLVSRSDTYNIYLFNNSGERVDQFGWYGALRAPDSSWCVMPDGVRDTYKGYDWETSHFCYSSPSKGLSNAGFYLPQDIRWAVQGDSILLKWSLPAASEAQFLGCNIYEKSEGDTYWGNYIAQTTDTVYKIFPDSIKEYYAVSAAYTGGESPRSNAVEILAGIYENRERNYNKLRNITKRFIYLEKGNIHISRIKIYDITGRRMEIDIRMSKNHLILDLKNLPDGVYFLRTTPKNIKKIILIK